MEESTVNRDASSLKIIGGFFVLLGMLVMAATAWTLDNVRAMVVNLSSGIFLAGVGAMMLLIARRLANHRHSASQGPDLQD